VGDDEATVGVAEEDQVGDADRVGGRSLFGLTDGRDRRAVDRVIEPPGVAVGEQAIGDVQSGLGERGYGSCGGEVDVVRMRDDDENPLDVAERNVRRSGQR